MNAKRIGPTRRFLLGLCAAGVAFAQATTQPSSLETFGLSNGRKWRTMDSGEQVFYLTGFNEALNWICDLLTMLLPKDAKPTIESARDAATSGMSFGEVQQAISIFYEDPTSRSIPISSMITVAAAKAKGTPAANIEKLLERNRAAFSKQ